MPMPTVSARPSVPRCCIFGPERPLRLPVFRAALLPQTAATVSAASVYSRVLPILEAARNDVMRVPESRERFRAAAKLTHLHAVQDVRTDPDAKGMLLAYEVFRSVLRDYSLDPRPAKRAKASG